MEDNWKHRSVNMVCGTCMYYVPKTFIDHFVEKGKQVEKETTSHIGRCRRNAPTIKGYPVVFNTDWCGEHKLDETKV